ncbi:MAG TPA: hypothetical protein VK801_00880 [Caulobacteraceae bacterium]|jgi:hypothetical protein|nr:hypothetical protein [Caulobacteraceae bacterium]
MAGRPPWALGLVALGLALAAAGCSESSSPKAGSSAITVAQGDNTDRGRIGSRIEQAEAAPPTGGADMTGDSPVPTEPPLPSTKRDEKTLHQDHPYRDRHGLTNCEIDCSVHEAGYKWAALHSLHDARFCAGRTVAFVDGCRAYVGDHRG